MEMHQNDEVGRWLRVVGRKLNGRSYDKLRLIKIPRVHRFIVESAMLCNPERIFVSDDSPSDVAYVRRMAIETGEEKPLAMPGHTVHFDGPYDQGRDREVTKYLVPKGDYLSKALNQIDRDEGLAEVKNLLKDSMKGRTMIVRFVCLGPSNSVFSILGVQCTDSWYVAHSEYLLFRPGYEAFVKAHPDTYLLRVLHSVGRVNENMVSVDHDKKRVYIDYVEDTIYSVNTQYAGNSVGFKKLAFRLAIRKAHREGWLAEHMMIIGVHGPGGRKTYFAGAFPSACGKTATAMLPGETILGDDIAFIRAINSTARAANAECGIFGILQGINPEDYPVLYKVLTSPGEVIFSNVLVKDGKPYWLEMGCELPKDGVNYTGYWWEGKTDENGEPILPAHKNARYTLSLKELENCDPELDNPMGVELGGIMYGGRDSKAYVPVQQSFNWEHGIICYGVALETETTFAIVGREGIPEINMMAMQDFISIPMGQVIRNSLNFGRKLKKPPLIFGVNYFLRDLKTGEYLNAPMDKHVWVKWMELRVHDDVGARITPTGLIPKYEDLRLLFKRILNKEYGKEDYVKQFTIRIPENLAKVERVERFYKEQVADAPEELFTILNQQRERLLKARVEFGMDYVPPELFAER